MASKKNCDRTVQKQLSRRTVGLDKLGRHEVDLVSLVAQLACPVMDSAPGLQADGNRGQLRHKGHQSMARQPLAPHHLSRGVRPHEVEDFFARSMPTVYTFCFIGLVSVAQYAFNASMAGVLLLRRKVWNQDQTPSITGRMIHL